MRALSAVLFILTVIAFSSASFAVPTATLTVSESGEYYYWFVYEGVDGNQKFSTPSCFKGEKTVVELPLVKDEVPSCRLFVFDTKTGNEAIVEIPAKPKEPVKINLESSDFDYIRKVRILVTSAASDKPVALAVVTLKDGKKNMQTQVLDPFSKGVAEFTDVLAGSIEITAACGDTSAVHRINLPIDHEQKVPFVEISLSGKVPTVKVEADKVSGETGNAQKGKTKSARYPGINFPMALIGLILLALIIYAAVRVLKSGKASLQEIMKKTGIDLPEEVSPSTSAEPSHTQVSDPSICPFCGSKRDPATGACACSVGATAGQTALFTTSKPKLVVTQGPHIGSVFDLSTETVTIGRNPSNTIALTQDSTVSRRHARIVKSNDEYTIIDEGSANGTFVNGVRVTQSSIRSGDEIQIGSTKLRFEN
jgi:hypothetical protein